MPSQEQIPDNHPAPEEAQAVAEWGSLTLRQACSLEKPGSAMCVQNFDDSRGLAIRITYRISLRSSSLWEPRHPLLKVVLASILDKRPRALWNHPRRAQKLGFRLQSDSSASRGFLQSGDKVKGVGVGKQSSQQTEQQTLCCHSTCLPNMLRSPRFT